MDVKKKNMTFFILGAAFVVVLLIYYNCTRAFNSYHWGFSGKEYSFNLIPFKNIVRTVSLLYINIIRKIGFFIILGFAECFTIFQIVKLKIRYFIVCSIIIISILELSVAFSSKNLVVIDINNFIFYAVGLAIGYLLFYLAQLIYKRLNFQKVI